ncbi:MAG: hypothetical protein AABX55_00310 [Nanoarchaeota archaeon]
MSHKQTEKSLEELIPSDFTSRHEELLSDLMIQNKKTYEEIFDLAHDALDDRDWCEEHGFSYIDQKMGDLFRVMYGYALQKKYI